MLKQTYPETLFLTFLSNMYNKDTQAKKFLTDDAQCGRSMIEMLGVLAITGVLSVGGIASFTQMSSRYKINETQSQITAIAAKLSTTSANGSYNGLNNRAAIKFHAVPDEMIVNKSAGTVENLYRGSVVIEASTLNASDSGKSAYTISVNNIPKEACIALATSDWGGAASFVGLTAGSTSFSETSAELFYGCSGKVDTSYATACVNGSTQKIPMQPTVAGKVCNCTNSKCFITLKFY